MFYNDNFKKLIFSIMLSHILRYLLKNKNFSMSNPTIKEFEIIISISIEFAQKINEYVFFQIYFIYKLVQVKLFYKLKQEKLS